MTSWNTAPLILYNKEKPTQMFGIPTMPSHPWELFSLREYELQLTFSCYCVEGSS